MSKFSKSSKKSVSKEREITMGSVKNFMGGTSYTLNPLTTLKIVAASSIFGEPSYYRDSHDTIRNVARIHDTGIFGGLDTKEMETTTDLFTKVIDESLSYDFGATLDLALRIRDEYNMRLNSAVIFIRAAQHPNRPEFNTNNPGVMRSIGKSLIIRPDDITNQFDYYMWLNVTKKGLPSIVKRVWADRLGEFDAYRINKYKSKSLIDLVRLSHAKSEVINELMTTGNVEVEESSQTWEHLRSEGKSWEEIINTIKIPHMGLLRNLRGIFTEVNNETVAKQVCDNLVSGVPYGRQFPFRYYTAYQVIESSDINHRKMVMDTLEKCLDVSVSNLPKLEGKTICLSDNSGSAWGSLNSEYGTVTVAEIGNLSSIVTALQSDEGEIGVFGDRLDVQSVESREGILKQTKEASRRGKNQGGATENGIWLFWKDAIENKKHYDNVVIFSDMQATHSGLFGMDHREYSKYADGRYINVLKLIETYRKEVNPKVNVTSVQTAGYNNSILPETGYRTNTLAGWTGKEATYISEMNKIWDEVEKENEKVLATN